MTKQEMMTIVYNQLAIDYNCSPEDFLKDRLIFTVAEQTDDRRAMPFTEPRLEMITFGRGVVINATKSIMPYVQKKLKDKSSYEVLNSPLVYGINPYYLPDVNNIKAVGNESFSFRLIDNDIQKYYKYKGLHNALQYDKNSERPEVLACVAEDNGNFAGIACASADSDTMWQIGVDVVSQYRGNGIAVKLVNMLTIEILSRGIVPYYTTDSSNLNSQRVAIKSGYIPTWSHCFNTRLTKSCLSRLKLNLF